MLQVIPRVRAFVGYGGRTQYFGVLSGATVVTPAAALHGNAPMPFAGTAKWLILSSGDTTRTADITLTFMVNDVPSALTVTLPAASTGPIMVEVDVSLAQGDDVCFEVVTGVQAFYPGWSIGVCLGVETAGNVYGVGGVGTGYIVPANGFVGGALGNGLFQGWGFQPVSNTYSICAIPGTLTTLVLRCGHSSPDPPMPVGATWTAWLRLNGVTQDGSPGTVDTAVTVNEIPGTNTAIGTFALPIVPPDYVDVVALRGGSPDNSYYAVISVGVGFVPDTDGWFMLCGGSNDSIGGPPLGYAWVRSEQDCVLEPLAQAPIGPGGVVARGLYIDRRAAPGAATLTHTLRRSGVDTSIVVPLVGLQVSGSITGALESYPQGTFMDLQILTEPVPGGGAMQWGLALSTEAAPGVGTIIVTKEAGGDTSTVFDFTAGGGLAPSAFSLVGGSSQIFGDLAPGSGYSVSEDTPPPGWQFVGVVVSNGSDPSNIAVADGESVLVTFTNANLCPGEVNAFVPRIDGLPYTPFVPGG